ncbi:uncharacterized protein LOC127706833 isoform X2 [Mytilus californianus]|uniref:uncharacterized protein LOC127706833 isoform X2 n=1 Tax=Mytilus californianus TaxID=6549 RepID=UPI0022453512|nr:uncharacterized protein LOC127706833 isoform X2 [Mytilus californianus]XP_052067503.1 uncharacterized protein LOC127706833 isoform X2 [Mytilus californianus]
MLKSLPVLLFLCVIKNAVPLEDGLGVCNRTERQTVNRVVTTEIIIGSTEVPCVVKSWLDELYCMNRKTITKNVTEIRNETVQEIVPMVVKFCCDGYTFEVDKCIMQTTIPTTLEETTTERTTPFTTVKIETTQAKKSIIPTTHKTTVKPEIITIKKSETKIPTTLEDATKRTTTTTTVKVKTSRLRPQTTIKLKTHKTTVKPETTTSKKSETTQSKIETTVPYIDTPTKQKTSKSVENFPTKSETTIYDMTPTTVKEVTFEATVKPKPITTDKTSADRSTNIPDNESDSSTKSSSGSLDTRDLLLYVIAACGLMSFITMTVVVGICYHRARRNNNRRYHSDILGMDIVRVNSLNHIHGVENPNYKEQNESEFEETPNYREQKQNCTNVCTEMRLTGANHYDELSDDYQDCDASPRLYKALLSPENHYEASKY